MVLAGEIGKPHGLSGEVYVVRISDDPSRFVPGSRLLRADGNTLTVETVREHGTRLLVKFSGIDDRDSAAGIRGPLFTTTSDLRELDNSEFWPHELVGCSVELANGKNVGTVKEVVPGAAHDLLVLRTSDGEHMVPMVKDIIVDVNIEARKITIDPPKGLVD
jgi:16S rRNA processing protein RimM